MTAKIGVYSLMILVFFLFVTGTVHSIPFLDNGSRALLSAIFNDAYYCVLAPALVLYGVPSLRRNLSSYLSFQSFERTSEIGSGSGTRIILEIK